MLRASNFDTGFRYATHKFCPYKSTPSKPTFPQQPNPNPSTSLMGYAYCVFKDGAPCTQGFYGDAQVGKDQNGNKTTVAWVPDTCMNIASVSKNVTAVTVMVALDVANQGWVLDGDFFPKVQKSVTGGQKR